MMQNILTNIKCSEIILSNANENWYIILYDLFSRLCYIATCGKFCKDATHIYTYGKIICTPLLNQSRVQEFEKGGGGPKNLKDLFFFAFQYLRGAQLRK